MCKKQNAMTKPTLPKETQRHPTNHWQDDNDWGWTWMALYWTVGACVGAKWGYLPPPRDDHHYNNNSNNNNNNSNNNNFYYYYYYYYYLTALLVTLACQPRLIMRFGSFGRHPSWTAVVLFSLLNGIFETVLFLASYDVGKWMTTDKASWFTRTASGFIVYMMYAAWIHVAFWLPHAFPRHVLPTEAPPFHTTMLPALILLSIAWIVLYETTHDIAAVCFLHVLTNVVGSWKMSLQPPSLFGCGSTRTRTRNLK